MNVQSSPWGVPRALFIALLLLLLLAACSVEDSSTDAGAFAAPGPQSPASAALGALYNRSCRSCHASGAASAPKTGDFPAWQPRLEQGIEVLLEHTISGFKGMPPLGLCFDCDEEDFIALITFMGKGQG